MRSIVILWTVLAGLCGGFLVWHSSWKGPLTDAEISTALTRMAQHEPRDTYRNTLQPELAGVALADFLATDDGRPFYMMNLMSFEDIAQYPGGEGLEGITGRDANAIYARYVIPNLLKRGIYPLIVTDRLTTLADTMGTGDTEFEQLALIRYRSRRDFLDLVSHPDFADAAVHKWVGLSGTLVAPTAMQLTLLPTLFVPIALIGIGGLGTLFLSWRNRTGRRPGLTRFV